MFNFLKSSSILLKNSLLVSGIFIQSSSKRCTFVSLFSFISSFLPQNPASSKNLLISLSVIVSSNTFTFCFNCHIVNSHNLPSCSCASNIDKSCSPVRFRSILLFVSSLYSSLISLLNLFNISFIFSQLFFIIAI